MVNEIKTDILYSAIDENINIILGRSEKDKDEFNFVSRFLQYRLDKKIITIDFPTAEREQDHLEKNDSIVIYFVYKGSRYVCHSTVLGLTDFTLSDGRMIKAMSVTLPGIIVSGERRNFFKIAIPPYEVDISIITRKDENASELDGILFKASAVNISGGGIAIKEFSDELPFVYGDILDLNIHFPDWSLHMEGKVVNKYQLESNNDMIFGIEFIQKNIDKLSFKKNVGILMRYVIKRERELLTLQESVDQ